MAELKKKVLGQVSGAVGDIVFRERYGLNYVGLRPSSFMPGTDAASVARRQRFALATRVGVTINSNPQLKQLWAAHTSSGLNTYNQIVKTNYRFVTSTDLSNMLQLTPDNGFGFVVTDSNVDRVRIRATIDPIGSNAGINIALEPKIMMAGLLFLSNPSDPTVKAYSLMSMSTVSQTIKLGTPLTFDADLTNQQQQVFDKYHTSKAFVALVTLDAANNPVHYSSTALLQ
jgi:hypothetical protein